MKNILIFASIAGIAAAIAIYFVSENEKSGLDRIEDSAEDAYGKMDSGIREAERSAERGFNAMS